MFVVIPRLSNISPSLSRLGARFELWCLCTNFLHHPAVIGVYRVTTTSTHTDVARRSEPQSWDKNETTLSVFFARIFAKKSEPPNSDVGGSDSRNAEAKKTA